MSAQIYSAIAEAHSQFPKELLFTLDKALNASKRSGWAWSQTRNNSRICSGSGMFGYPVSMSLTRMGSQAEAGALYLSAPPHSGFITLDELILTLQAANIRELNIPCISSPWWFFGKQQDVAVEQGIAINRFPVKDIGHQVYYGPYSLVTKKRPWITCVTATSMNGDNVDMQLFSHDFGFNQRIHQRVLSSHAVIIDSSVSNRPYQALCNSAGSELLLHQYQNQPKLHTFLSHLAKLQLSTAVIIVNYDTSMQLLNAGLVDELLITYQLLDCQYTQPARPHLANLNGWTMIDSHLLSLGVLVELINKPY